MDAILYDLNNSEKGKLKISENIFNSKVNDYLVWLAVTVEEANKRQGSACVKTKAEVHGSGKKPYAQKGTGRSRVGIRQNPIWTGGGVAFGPKPRSYNKKINKKMKRKAYVSLLSLKFKKDSLKFIENINTEDTKTKDYVKYFENFRDNGSLLVIYGDKFETENVKGQKVLSLSDKDKKFKKMTNNLKIVKTLHWNALSAKDIFYAKNILVTEDAKTNIEEKYSNI